MTFNLQKIPPLTRKAQRSEALAHPDEQLRSSLSGERLHSWSEQTDRLGATLSLHMCSRFPPGFSCYRLGWVPVLINKVMTVSRGVEGETARCAWVEGRPSHTAPSQSCHDRELMKQLPFKQQIMRETHNVLSTRQGIKQQALWIFNSWNSPSCWCFLLWICPHVNHRLYGGHDGTGIFSKTMYTDTFHSSTLMCLFPGCYPLLSRCVSHKCHGVKKNKRWRHWFLVKENMLLCGCS